MKKLFLFGCLILITACQTATQIPTPDSILTQTILPSPLPVTATQTFISPPSSTPFPLYFIEEFTNKNLFWEFFQTGGINFPTATFENDTLHINITSPDTWLIGIHNVHAYSNVYLRAKANISPTGSFGLICRYQKYKGWYEFNIYSDGTYNLLLGQWLTEEIARYIPISTEFSGHIKDSTEIGLHCQDNFLLLYVNNNLIKQVDVTNYGLGEGQVGITASSISESPISINFEWVQVSE